MHYDNTSDACYACTQGPDVEHKARCRSCTNCRVVFTPDGKSTARCACSPEKCKDGCDAPGCQSVVTQKRIWKQVRAAESMYTGALGALTVVGGPSNKPKDRWSMVNWNQMSDRAVPGVGTAYVPSRGNSTRGSTVRHRPGSGGYAGVGVDIKHGSYARYLARLKAPNLRTERSTCNGANTEVDPILGNKRRKIGIVNGTAACC